MLFLEFPLSSSQYILHNLEKLALLCVCQQLLDRQQCSEEMYVRIVFQGHCALTEQVYTWAR